MNEILKKLSTYNIFNYLFPGVLFVLLSEKYTSYSFIQEDILLGLFLYYFIGLVISRIGSLIVEPVLKRFKVIKFTDYNDFVEASKKDEKIELFSEINNMYRTICALFFSLIILRIYQYIESAFKPSIDLGDVVVLFALFVLFVISYRKQTSFISERTKITLNKEKNNV